MNEEKNALDRALEAAAEDGYRVARKLWRGESFTEERLRGLFNRWLAGPYNSPARRAAEYWGKKLDINAEDALLCEWLEGWHGYIEESREAIAWHAARTD